MYLHLEEDVLLEYFGLEGGEGIWCVRDGGFFTEVGTYSMELLLLPWLSESKVYLLQPGVGL